MLQPGRLYVYDRGYLDHELYRDILDAGSSFIGRIKDNGQYTVAEVRPLSAEAREAGVVSDELVRRLGTSHHKNVLKNHQVRLVKVQRTNDNSELETWWLLTDRLDLPAELVALGYRYRWTVELFFRWLKCVLGCKQLLTTSANGVALADLHGAHCQPAHRPVDRSASRPNELGKCCSFTFKVGPLWTNSKLTWKNKS